MMPKAEWDIEFKFAEGISHCLFMKKNQRKGFLYDCISVTKISVYIQGWH